MHFWIDKRAQTCGFGRARVGASFGTNNVGLVGFGGPPRRMISKPPAASIHRMQSNYETQRPHSNNNNNNNSSSNANNNNSNTTTTANSTNGSNANNSRNNRSRSNNNSNSSSPYQQRHPADNNHHNRQQHNNQQQQNQRHQNQPTDQQPVVAHSLPRTAGQLLAVNNQYNIPVALPHNYGGPSHLHDLEQGPLDIETYPIRASTMAMNSVGPTIPSDGHIALADASTDTQLLPQHLKFGMCASLVLASVFIAGAKYYFDHQGGSMDVLIFCAFLAISFLALCTVSLCRYVPRDLAASPAISVDGHSRMLEGQMHLGSAAIGTGMSANGSPHPHLYAHGVDPNVHDLTHSPLTSTTAAPPPPYHIAILLPPESGKEIEQLDEESPPPSYDKILI